jgi:hypothetical protein
VRQSFSFPALHAPFHFPSNVPDNTTVNRRQNALGLFQRFAEERMRAGEPPKGLEQAFAQQLQISPSMWSQIKSSRPIGDKLARQIEVACATPAGWLDEAHAPQGPSPAEQLFLALALKAWRATNAEGRKRLKQWVREAADAGARDTGTAAGGSRPASEERARSTVSAA